MSSTVIDNRVVEMHFDNKDFEKNVKESMSTLDKLKNALNMDSAKSLETLGKATNGFTMDGINTAIETSKLKFSALQVAGITAISKITGAAMDAGVKLVKSLSVDQITRGFDKYAEKTQAVQTIMSATGETIEQITEQIDKLNWFTDETSYNLIDMTNNIAKFTSNGIALEDATKQMMGIATAAALAGANSQDASHAMTGFSKAIGAGAMKRQNWQWIQTAHMDTMAFKQSLIDAAVEMGTLQKVGDGLWVTMDKNEVSLSNFEEAMKDGWITTKVMTGALEQYGNFSEKLHGSLQKLDNAMSTSELLDYLEDYKAGTLDIKQVADDLEISSEDLKSVMEELSDESLALGEKSFRAAQEAKTFQEAIDAVKDAVSTAWMTTFENIFGNYEEAKKLWTGVANGMWEVFAAGGEKRNQVLGIWKELGGRDSLLRGVFTMLNSILKPLQAVKAAFASLFPSSNKGLANMLLKITQGFERFAEKLKPSQELLEDIYWAFSGIFTAGKLVVTIFTDIVKAIFPVTKPLGSIASITVHILGLIGKYTTVISNFIIENGVLKGVIETIGAVLQKVSDIMFAVLKVMGGGLLAGVYALVTAMAKGVTTIKNFAKNSKTLQTVITALQNGLAKVVGLFTGFKKGTDGVTTVVKKAKTYFGEFTGAVAESGTITKEATKDMTTLQKVLYYLGYAAKVAGGVIVGAFGLLGTAVTKVGSFFKGLFTNTAEYFTRLKDTIVYGWELVKGFFGNIKDSIVGFLEAIGINTDDVKKKFEGIGTILKDFFSRITVGKVIAIAFAGALLYVSMASVKLVDSWTQVGKSASGLLNTIKGTFGGINKFFNTLDENLKKKTTFKEFAQSIAILTASLIALTYAIHKDKDAFITAAVTIGAMASAAFLLTWGLTKLSNSLSKNGLDNKFNSNARGMLILAGAIGILSVAMMAITKVDLSGETFKSIVAKLGILTAMIGIMSTTAVVLSKFAPQLSKGGFLLISLALSMKVIMETMLLMSKEDFSGVKDNIADIAAVFAAFSIVTFAASKLNLRSAMALLTTALALKMLMPMIIQLMRTVGDASKDLGIKEKALAVLDSINSWIQSLIDKYGVFKGNLAAFVTIGGTVAAGVATLIGAGMFLAGLAEVANIFKGIGLGIVGLAIGFKIVVSAMDDFDKATKEMSSESLKAFSDALLTFVGISGMILALVAVINGLVMIAGNLTGVDKLKLLKTNFASVGVAMIGIGASVLMIAQAVKIMSKVANDTEAFNSAKDAVVTIMLMLSLLVASASLVKKAMPVIATFASILVGISVVLAELAILALFKPEELVGPALAMIGVISALAAMVYATSKLDDAKKLKVLIPVVLMLAEIGSTLIIMSKYKHAWYDYLAMGGAISMAIMSLAFLLKTISKSSGLGSASTSTKKMQLLIPLIFIVGGIGAALGTMAMYKHDFTEYLAMGASISLSILSFAAMIKVISDVKVQDVHSKIALMTTAALSMVALAGAMRMISDQEIPNVWSSLGALEVGLWSMVGVVAVIGLMSKTLDVKALVGTIVTLISVCGVLVTMAYTLQMLGDMDVDKINSARNAIAAISGVMIGLVAVAGLMQAALVAIGGALGATAGEAIGAAALPALILSIGGAVAMMGAGLYIGAKAIEVLSGCLGMLVPPLQQMQSINMVQVSGGLALLGLAMIPLAIGMVAAGVACVLGAGGLTLLGLALNVVGPAADKAVEPLQKLSEVDMSGMGKGMLSMAVGGIALIPAAVGVALFATALSKLAAVSETLQNVKTQLTSFSTDVSTAMQQGAQTSTKAALLAGLKTAAGWIFGFRKGAEWHSPPQFIVDFMNDVGLALGNNGQATQAAATSGAQVGNTFGLSVVSTVQGWISKIGGALGGMFGEAEHQNDKYVHNTKKQYDIMSDVIDGLEDKSEGAKKSNKGLWDTIKDASKNILPDFTGDLFDIDGILEPINSSLEEMTSNLGGGTEALEGLGDAAGGAGGKLSDLKDIVSSVRDSVANMDIFTKFEMKTEMTAQQMLDNMKSNLDGVASWSHKLAVLAERGIDQALYQKLAEMGPQSYEQVNAFVNMTDEQLKQANEMFATSLAMPDASAAMVGAGYKKAGEMAILGFSNALGQTESTKTAAGALGKAALDGLNEALDIHSPSGETYKSGTNATAGLRQGISDEGALSLLKVNIRMVCRIALGEFNDTLGPTKTYEIGKNATMGLANGIADSEAAKAVLEKAGEIARAAAEMMAEALDEHSPSRLTEKIGLFADYGVVNGLDKGARKVMDAAWDVGAAVHQGIQDAVDKINNFIDLNLNPIITPILDLSYMQQQMSNLNSSFGVTASGAGQIQNGESTTATPGGVTFVQNNYSPKELSRIDIYRDTKNQISMIGKVVAGRA